MANGKGVRAGAAYVEITTDITKLEEGLRRAQKRLWALGEDFQRYGRSFMAVGGAMLAPFIAGLKQLAAVDPQVAKDLKEIKDAFNGIFITIGRIVHGALKPYIGTITNACRAMALWIQQHAMLILKIMAVAAAILAVGTVLVTLGAIIKAVAGFIAVLTAVVTVARAAWVAYASSAAIAQAVLMFFADWKKALAIVAAIAAVTAGIVYGAKKLNDMFDSWGKNLNFQFPNMPSLEGANAQLTTTKNTYAHLNGEAFTHLFGGKVQQNLVQQQLNAQKEIARNTKYTNALLEGVAVG